MSKEVQEKYKGFEIVSPEFRLSFPVLDKPRRFKGKDGKEQGEPKYSITMLYSPKTDRKEMIKAVNQAAAEVWPNKEDRPAAFQMPFSKGDDKGDLQGFAGQVVARAATMQPVGLCDNKGRTILRAGEEPRQGEKVSPKKIYAGCYARAILVAKAYNLNKNNCGVTFYLQGVEFVRDGEPLGGGGNVAAKFGHSADDLDDDDNDSSDGDDDSDDAGF